MSAASVIDPVDIDHVLDHTSALWPALRSARIFLTGGSGFVGKWLIETALAANVRHRLGLCIHVLSRDVAAFRRTAPWITEAPGVELSQGDIRTFDFPAGSFSHAIHAATDLAVGAKPLYVHDVIVAGTRRVLEFVAERRVPEVLLISSGAVYGAQPDNLERLEEDFPGAPAPNDLRQAYGVGKREAEWLGHAFASAHDLKYRVVRPFALIGAYLPLSAGYAAGSFVSDLLAGRSIHVAGDGMTLRTYLYASDMAIWMWTALLRGPPGFVCNVGGEEIVSVADLAGLIAGIVSPALPVHVAHAPTEGRAANRYVPSIARAHRVLGLTPTVLLEEGLRRMIKSYQLAAARRQVLA